MMAPAKALAIVELRRKRLTQARIAQALGVAARTFSRVLARAGLSRLADLERAEPAVRYEHTAPGELLHIDIKKLGRVVRPGHRVLTNALFPTTHHHLTARGAVVTRHQGVADGR